MKNISKSVLKCPKTLIYLSIVCFVLMVFVSNHIKYNTFVSDYSLFDRSLDELQKMRQKHELVYNELQKVRNSTAGGLPSLNYEKSLRRIGQNMNDLWHNLKETLNSTQLKFFNELRYSLLTDLNIITERDNELRRERLESLNDFISDTITRLQNPKDCKTARKLICQFRVNCGFGCLSQYWTNCLIASLALNRTMIIDKKMIYFDKFLKPLSETCLDLSGDSRTSWGQFSNHSLYQVLEMETIWEIRAESGYPEYYPPKIPVQLSERLQQLSGDPYVLFVGNILRYVLRTNKEFTEYLLKFKKKIQSNHPIVGIHVRRTDKLTHEADYHPLDQYMSYAEDFFNKIDLTNERNGLPFKMKRIVYLATDEINVWTNEVKPWIKKGYKFLGDSNHSNTARDVMSRFGVDSTRDSVTDLLMLSECDFIVCGLSSTYCRSAVRLMHTRDPSLPYQTVDNPYFYAVWKYQKLKAILSNKGHDKQELNFSSGDVITIDKFDLRMEGYFKYGYRYAKLFDTNDHKSDEMIKFPAFKMEPFIETYHSLAFD